MKEILVIHSSIYNKKSSLNKGSLPGLNYLFVCSVFLHLQFGTLEFPQKVDVMITLSLDPDKTRADGKIHDCTTHVNLKYIGPADTCTSSSGSREFAHEGPATASFKYYVKRKFIELL